MKSITISSTIILAFLLSNSCSKSDLDVQPTSATEATYFETESQFEKAIVGLYAKLTDFYWYNGGQDNCVQPVTILPGDDITTTSLEEFEAFSTLQPGSSRLNYFYSAAYQLINRATIILDKNTAVKDGIYVTTNLKNNHRGEALFLRSYAYYLLWNIFGTPPLVTARIKSLDEIKPPSSKDNQLLDQAITDLTEAATLLPSSWSDDNRGRITANSANGLLGKCLVFRATVTNSTTDYQSAIAAFGKISGATLVANFNDNFNAGIENNNESLFEVQTSQAFGFDNVWLPNDFDNAVGALSVYWGFYDNGFAQFGKAPFIATQKLADIFAAGDLRRDSTLDPGSLAIRKYVTHDVLNQPGASSVNNPRVLRLADVLLLQAEAINESGGSAASAINLINQVRTRARGAGTVPANISTGITDKATIRQLIMDERLMELAGEGQRWFDLRRWHLAGFITLNNAFFNSADPSDMSFETKNIYFPIPSSEILVNPNIIQNTGY